MHGTMLSVLNVLSDLILLRTLYGYLVIRVYKDDYALVPVTSVYVCNQLTTWQ